MYLIYSNFEDAKECNRIMSINAHSAFSWSEVLKINRDGVQYAVAYSEDLITGIPPYLAIEAWNDSWTIGLEEV